ncbi:MAG: hypothetical protein R3D00_31485 [Bacteroidia bacterium]
MRKLKYVSVIVLTIALIKLLPAQNSRYSQIPLSVAFPTEMDSVPQNARNLLQNRLQQAANQTGGPAAVSPRFVLTATPTILGKTIVAGSPVMITYSIELNLYVVDFYDKKIFTSTSVGLKGVGETESKAISAAFQQLRATDSRVTEFLKESRTKIGSYYDKYCNQVLDRAYNLTNEHKFAEAFHTLSLVPEACTSCYEQANGQIISFYQRYLDYVCAENLAKAQAIWVAGQNGRNATEAGKYLSQILPDAACYNDAQKLIITMQERGIQEDWEFEMSKYYDDLRFRWQKHTDEVELEKLRIEAARQVGIEDARNKPVYYYTGWSLFGWRWFVW